MADRSQKAVPPAAIANVTPDIGGTVGQTRILIDAVKEQISEIKSDVKDIRTDQRTDFRWILGTLITVVIFITGLMFTVYSNMTDKINGISKENTRIETKLDGLIERTTPAQAPAPRK